MNPPRSSKKRAWIYWLIMLAFTTMAIAVILYLALPLLRQLALDKIISNPVALLDNEHKEELYRRLAADLTGIYDSVPDSAVGKILQKNIDKTQRGAQVITNNAGFRDNRPYTRKSANTFRIICLGDSFVEGTAGNVEDRFCNQIEDTINLYGLLGHGITAEAYAIGVGSWTAVNGAAYMISHISAYEPDLIIAMLVSNDIADGQGVSGIGASSNAFSPEARTLGSGIFSAAISINFGESGNLLKYDLGTESVKRWNKAFALYKKLEDLQHERGGKIIFSVLDTIRYFSELARSYHAKFEMTSPFLSTSFFPAEDTVLPHDGHPNRNGHQIVANHYLHAMVQESWISDPEGKLDALNEGLSLDTAPNPDFEYLEKTRRALITEYLPQEINFNNPGKLEIGAFLGGIWPDMSLKPENRSHSYPFGTTRTGFLLARTANANQLKVEIFIPRKVELFPNTIQLFVNGRLMDSLILESASDFGEKTLSANLTIHENDSDVLEVILSSETFWSTISDNTMRSYELRKAFQSGK